MHEHVRHPPATEPGPGLTLRTLVGGLTIGHPSAVEAGPKVTSGRIGEASVGPDFL